MIMYVLVYNTENFLVIFVLRTHLKKLLYIKKIGKNRCQVFMEIYQPKERPYITNKFCDEQWFKFISSQQSSSTRGKPT